MASEQRDRTLSTCATMLSAAPTAAAPREAAACGDVGSRQCSTLIKAEPDPQFCTSPSYPPITQEGKGTCLERQSSFTGPKGRPPTKLFRLKLKEKRERGH